MIAGFMPRNLYCIFTANMVLNGAVFRYFSLPTPKTDSKLLQAKSAGKQSKRGRNTKFLQEADRNDVNAVQATVGIVADADKHHQKRRHFHFYAYRL